MLDGAGMVIGMFERLEPSEGAAVLLSEELSELMPVLLLEGLSVLLSLEGMPLVVEGRAVSLGGVVLGLDEDEVEVPLSILVVL